jgi:outer membrane lipoprotein carrier protein
VRLKTQDQFSIFDCRFSIGDCAGLQSKIENQKSNIKNHLGAWVFLLAVALAWPMPAAAQSLSELIDQLQKKYSRLESVAGEFMQIYHAPGSRTLREQGHVLLARPRRMRWQYTYPEEKLFISDGKIVYFYVPADRQVTRAKIKEADDLRASFAFLLGSLDLRQHFPRIELIRSEAPVDAGNHVLRLVPRDRRVGFAELIIEVNPSTLQLRRVSIMEVGGARSDFLFFNLRENVPAPEKEFAFTIPANVQVLEDR